MNSIAQFSGLDQGRIPFSSISSTGGADTAGMARNAGTEKAGGFADLLEKARAQGSSAPPSRKPVIDKTDKLYEQCRELETFLLKNLINGMRKTVQKTELFDDGFAGEIYEDMLYDEYTGEFARNAGFGFAELAYLELTGQRGKTVAGHG
ncbi:MAG: rod-binding protein [Treponema sp.]|jgi:flagellar protein FlgJ|nr:rod-binding protein [Treponema sp.]